MKFLLQENPIDPVQTRNIYPDSGHGALVSFEGIVRSDQIKGRQVSALLYIADAPACLLEGEKILKEARNLFPITEAVCIQRTGKLNAGETAVWIGVWAGHRDEAFKGCRHIIEEIKKRLPIWKKEFYADGTSGWVRAKELPPTPSLY